MARYLARSCLRSNGYLGIVIREPGRKVAVQAGNGAALNVPIAWPKLSSKNGWANRKKMRSHSECYHVVGELIVGTAAFLQILS